MVRRAVTAAAGCAVLAVLWVGDAERNQPAPPPRIEGAAPEKLAVRDPLRPRTGGNPAVRAKGHNLFRGTRLLWNGEALESWSDWRGSELTALIPERLCTHPGAVEITAEQPGGAVSAPVYVRLVGAEGAAPEVNGVYPDTSAGDRDFGRQPGGRLAMAVTGANFLPEAVVVLGGVDLETVFGGSDRLSAFVPQALVTRPRVLEVRVRNPDGKVSAAGRLAITAP